MSLLRYKMLQKGFVRPYLLKRLADYPTKAEGESPSPPPPSQPPKPAKPKKTKAPPKPAAAPTPKPSAPPTPSPKPAAHEPPPSTPAPQEPAKKPFAVSPEPAEPTKLQELRRKYSAQAAIRANQLKPTNQVDPDDLPEGTLRKYPAARRQEVHVPSGNRRPETRPVDVHLSKEEAERQVARAHRGEGYKPPAHAVVEKTPQEEEITEALVDAFLPTFRMWESQEKEGYAGTSLSELLTRSANDLRTIARQWMVYQGVPEGQINEDSVDRVLEDVYAHYYKYEPHRAGQINPKQVQAMVNDKAWPMLKDYLLENVEVTSTLSSKETKQRVDQAVQLIQYGDTPRTVLARLERQLAGTQRPLTAQEENLVKQVTDQLNNVILPHAIQRYAEDRNNQDPSYFLRPDRVQAVVRRFLPQSGMTEEDIADADVNKLAREVMTLVNVEPPSTKSLTGYHTKAEGTPPQAQPPKPDKAPKAKAPPKPAAQPAPRPAAKAPAKPKPKPAGQQPAKATDTETRVEATPPQAPPSKIQELRQKYTAQHAVRANQLRPTNQPRPEEPLDQPVANEPATRIQPPEPATQRHPSTPKPNLHETPTRAQEILRTVQAQRDEERDQPRIMKEREEKRKRREEEMKRAKPEKQSDYVENPEQTHMDWVVQSIGTIVADDLFTGEAVEPNGDPVDLTSYRSVRNATSEQIYQEFVRQGIPPTEADLHRVSMQAMEMVAVTQEQIALLREAFPNEAELVNDYINNLILNYGVRGFIEFDPEQLQERFRQDLNEQANVDELLFPDPEVNLDLPDGWVGDNHYEEEDYMP